MTTDKEKLVQSIMDAPDREKMDIITKNFDQFSAQEIEEISLRIITDLQTSLEQHERRSSAIRTETALASKSLDIPSALAHQDSGNEEDAKHAILAVVSDAVENGLSKEDNLSMGTQPGEDVSSAADEPRDTAVLAESVPSDDAGTDYSKRYSPLVRMLRSRQRAAAARTSAEDFSLPIKPVGSLHKVAMWAAGGVALNVVAIVLASLTMGSTIAQAVPLLLWILFALVGFRHKEAIAGLAVSMGSLIYYGWPMLEHSFYRLALFPMGLVPPVDSMLFGVSLLAAVIMTLAWPFIGPQGKDSEQALRYRV